MKVWKQNHLIILIHLLLYYNSYYLQGPQQRKCMGRAAPLQHTAMPSCPLCLLPAQWNKLLPVQTPPKHPHSPQESRAPCFVLPPSGQGHSKHCTLFEMGQRTVKARFCYTDFSPWGGEENKTYMTANSHVVWHTGARYSDTACAAWAPPNPTAPSPRARGPWLRLWCDSSQRCLGLQGWCLSSISWTRKVWFSNIAVSAQVAGWPPCEGWSLLASKESRPYLGHLLGYLLSSHLNLWQKFTGGEGKVVVDNEERVLSQVVDGCRAHYQKLDWW